MAIVDPYKELKGRGLRNVVIDCLDDGRVLIPEEHAGPRMDERHVTTPEVEGALRSGAHTTDSITAGKFRYKAVKSGVEVIFTFDVDEDGNLLVVVTVMRSN